MPSWKKLLTSGSDISVNNLNTEGIRFFGGSVQLAISGSGGQGGSLGIGDLPHNNSYTKLTLQAAQTHSIVLDSGDIKLDGIHNQASEATSLMINGSGVVGTRELGSNAFTSTTIGTTTNNLSVDNSTLALNSGTTFNGSAARTISIKADGVGSAQIADDAINSEHYTDGSIDTAHIADLQITTAKIAADAITGAKIADDVVDSEHIAAGAIDTEHIAADQVTYAKIQNVSATDRILGRDSAGAGVIEEISPSALRTMINVEDGATADQTKADINALDITEVGTIDSGVWNGTAIASAYLDADTAHLSGTQTFSGAKTFSSTATFTNAIQLNDSDIIYLGTGQDFEIYHDGSNAYFRGKKHGGLAYFQLENSAGTNQNAIILGESGSAAKVGVELRYNNVGRIWTTNDGSAILKPSIMGLSNQEEEATALMINGSNVVGTRELGSNAFTSTTIGTTSNALTVDNTTIQLNSGTTFNGSGARTISAKTAAIANGGSGLATADQIHTFVTTQTDAIDADTSGNAATATALATAREIAGVSFDGTANISLNNNAITNGAGYTTNTGTVDTSGTPVDNDYAKFTDANTIEGRSASEVKTDLSLNNVENTAISTFAGTSNITTVGTIGTGTWQGTAIASAYLDSDTAHLSGTQTFSGAKTFSSNVVVPSIKVGADGGIVDSEGVQAISIDDSANVLIGNGLLTVEGTGTSEFTSHLKAHCLGIGTNPSGTQGEIRATNDITAYYSSDIRLKENIHSLKGTLEKLDSIRAVSYDWKELTEEERKTVHSHTGSDIGVIAQEVEEVFPDLVEDRPNGYKAVNYEKLSAVLLSAVKELKQEVEELKQKIK